MRFVLPLVICLLQLVLAGCAAFERDWRFVAAEQASASLVIYSGKPGTFVQELWRWDPKADSNLTAQAAASFSHVDECKPVDGGRTILVNASHGGVAAVDVATCQAKWYAFMSDHRAGPHSVDLLPDGRIAVANSTGVDALQIVDLNGHPFDPSKQKTVNALPVAGAHGVVWDGHREKLYVLGYTNLLELAYLPETMGVKVLRTWDYSSACGDPYGHDLVPDGRGGYYFTNHTGVWGFNPEDGAFVRILDIKNVKSFSRDAVKGDLLAIPRESWWTDRLLVRTSDGVLRTIGPFPGVRFYKARWMDVSVSVRSAE